MAQNHDRGALPWRKLQLVGLMLALLTATGCGGDKESGPEFSKGSLLPASQRGTESVANDSIAMADSTALLTGTSSEMPSLEAVPAANDAGQSTAAKPSASQKAEQMKVAEPKAAKATGTYSVQIGSFRSAENARALVERVTDLGYRPEVEVASLGGQTYHRVVVSGLFTRQEAEQCGEHLRTAEGITYLIRHR